MVCQGKFVRAGRSAFPAIAAVAILVLFSLSSCRTTRMKHVSLIVRGTIHTLDERNSLAGAMAVDGDSLVATGSAAEILAAYEADTVIDTGGNHVFPGFIDAHAHLLGLGENLHRLNLAGAPGVAEVARMVARRAASRPPGSWIVGRGWDQNLWPGKRFPTKNDLDAAAPDHPVFLVRIDGHAAWVNSAALRIAGIGARSDTAGGTVVKDARGEPTGILLDNAVELVRARIPAYTPDQLEEMYTAAVAECLRNGLTQVHDMGIDGPKIAALKRLIARGDFPFRVYAMVDGAGPDWESLLDTGKQTFGASQLVLGGLKLYADGALGSRGALLKIPYADDPKNSGIPITPDTAIKRETIRAMKAGLQVCVHAIGDSANSLVLKVFSDALKAINPTDPRLRIEHAQVIDPADIPRFRELGVIPSMQPTHCTSDMRWAERRLGHDRIRGAYAWQSLRKSGAIIPGGSDFPVEKPDPLKGMYAAVTRRDAAGKPSSQADIDADFQLAPSSPADPERYRNGWYGAERLPREDAVRMFTTWAAYAAFQEKKKGSLIPGGYADFVILDKDIMTIPDAELLETRVLATYVGGKRVYVNAER